MKKVLMIVALVAAAISGTVNAKSCSYSRGASQVVQRGVLCKMYNLESATGASSHEVCFPAGTNCALLPQVG